MKEVRCCSFMTVYSRWKKALLALAKGWYLVPRVCPKSSFIRRAPVRAYQVSGQVHLNRGLYLKKPLLL